MGEPKKIVIIGDGACGKTCFLYRFIEDKFTEVYDPTIFENYKKEYDFNGEKKNLLLCDTAGQEDYDALRPISYNNVSVAFIAFSVVSRASFNNVEKKWFKEHQKYMKKSRIVLLGTKEDLRGDEAALAALRSASGPEAAPVSEAEATEVARRIRAHSYCLTSAKTGQGVTEAFNAAITAAEAPPDGANPTCCILL